MVNIANSCDLPDVQEFVGDLESEPDRDLALAPSPAFNPAIAIGVGVDAVTTALTFVGLEAFILATALEGETLIELLLELQTDPELQQEIRTRIRTDTQRCLSPALPRVGLGSKKSNEVQEEWNELGSEVDETTKRIYLMVSTPAQANALRAWRRTLAMLSNCLEILIEKNIFCRGSSSTKRCRVPAMVEPCALRASPEKPE